jgi:UDP-3-O-acyl-N-acetylglucosamine deacetylase
VENVKKAKVRRETAEEIDLLDTMLSSLVELLEEKGIITQEEYERRIKEKVKIINKNRWQ